MIEGIKRIFSIPELKARCVFTLLLLAVCRIGAYVPVPGINGSVAVELFKSVVGAGQNLFQLMDVFSGGAFAQMTVFALGVMPYITSTIIMQLVMALSPSFQREIRENGEAGKRKMSKWTRILTIAVAFFQSWLYARYAYQLNVSNPGIIVQGIADQLLFGVPVIFFMVVMFTMTAGTVLLMWLGEQITERGVGNGVSLIITIGILSSVPRTMGSILRQLNLDSQEPGQLSFSSLIVLCSVFVLIIIGTILIIQGQRKIPLQYARRVVGRHEVQGAGSAYIPLKINHAGVVPVIFASSLLMVPASIAQFMSRGSWLSNLVNLIAPGGGLYMVLYVLLIIFFTYFWTATQFHPEQIASDMKKNGAFIPGVRQGGPTQEYLETTMSRITLMGALFLALIAVLPSIIGALLSVDQTITYFFGGTSLLILVGVVLDTTKQIESHLITRRYEGFMKRGKLRAR